MCALADRPESGSSDSARKDSAMQGVAESRIQELKEYLRGFNHKPDFFSTPPLHDIDDLHKALYLAAVEVVQRLDPELEATVHMAGEPEYNIQLDEDEFLDTRKIDVDEIRDMGLDGVKMLSRERTVLLLTLARDEIEWMSNEIRRLEMHCRNARELKQSNLRTSFEYRPSPRRPRIHRPSNFLSGTETPVMVHRGKKEDEEMMDVGADVGTFRSWEDVKEEERSG